MNRSPLLGALCLALPIACADAQNLVYEAPERALSPTSPYFGITEGAEYADAATLGGTDRFVTEASLRVYSGVTRTGDVTFSLYEAVPLASLPPLPGTPGVDPGRLAEYRPATTPLASVTLNSVTFNAATDLNSGTELIFSGINTLVEDDLFWAVRFENVDPLDGTGNFGIFFGQAENLTVPLSETDPSRIYARNSDTGSFFVTSFPTQQTPTSSFAVSISAIPEPTPAALVLIGFVGVLLRRRR